MITGVFVLSILAAFRLDSHGRLALKLVAYLYCGYPWPLWPSLLLILSGFVLSRAAEDAGGLDLIYTHHLRLRWALV